MAIATIRRLCHRGAIWEAFAIFGRNGMAELPPEKEFTHRVFCQEIQNIDIDTAKKLLEELHLLYLGQQAIMVAIAKGKF